MTEFALEIVDDWSPNLGFTVNAPRDPAQRGGHITLIHANARAMTKQLWHQDVIPDYRNPNGIRVGMSPLSTSFSEVAAGLAAIRALAE